MNAPVTAAKLYDCRDAFAETLEALAAGNDKVVAVCNDSVGSSKLGGFKSKFPERLVNVGIAEQNLVGVAATSLEQQPLEIRGDLNVHRG